MWTEKEKDRLEKEGFKLIKEQALKQEKIYDSINSFKIIKEESKYIVTAASVHGRGVLSQYEFEEEYFDNLSEALEFFN